MIEDAELSPGGLKPWEPETDPRALLRPPGPGLHVVSTPIGNLGDITLRALTVLRGVQAIACEDTRVSAKLCARYDITAPLLAYHDHNAERARPALLGRIASGQAVALISDAGTPLVSDPGYKLVREVIAAGHEVHVVPGASAALSALVLSGLPSDRFFFAGFLPPKMAARRRELALLAAIPATLIFYESGPRLADSLADMAEMLGPREASISREITKLHEETRRGSLGDLAAHYAQAGAPKGEIVVLTGPPLPPPVPDEAMIDALLLEAIARDGVRNAAVEIARRFDRPRREIYARALLLSGRGVGDQAGGEAEDEEA